MNARWPMAVLAACGVVSAGVLLWAAPLLAERLWMGPRAANRGADPAPTEALDAFLAEQLAAVGATATDHREADPSAPWVARLPRGVEPAEAARQIRAAAQTADIELYSTPRSDLDIELRVYDGKALARRVILRPMVSALSPAPEAPTSRERPLLSVVVADLGAAPPGDLAHFEHPLTLALRPFEPWTLSLARDGMLHWHEILVEADAGVGAAPIAEQLHAVPYASGLLLRGAAAPVEAFGDLARRSVVVYEGDLPALDASAVSLVGALSLAGAPAPEAIARGVRRAARDGVATVVVSADDPALAEGLSALRQADALGYRLVLASEAARWEQVRGLPSGADPASDDVNP